MFSTLQPAAVNASGYRIFRKTFELSVQNLFVGRLVRLEGAEINPIALHHVFSQMLDLKLQLRLPDRMRPALLL